jgi:ABC-type glycerol-3-phosphate transport system substrate-binding protein
MKTKLIIVAVFLVAVGAILFFTLGRKDKIEAEGDGGPVAAGSGSAPKPADQVEINVTYSSEKKDWIEAAATPFRKDHPEIKLNLNAKSSIAAAQAITDDKDKPTIFSPADTLIMNMAASDWKMKGRGDLFATSGEDAPQSLVITPIVFAIWDDRAQVLLKAGNGKITWKTLQKVINDNKGWPAIGGKAEWGFVKLGHTDPTQANSGLETLYLMSIEYYGKPRVDVGDLLDPKYQQYVKDIEKGVSKFEVSTKQFMDDMIRFGPSKYDVAVVYENLALSQLQNAQGRWGHLRVYYPGTTVWSDHPAAIVQGDWVTPKQKEAARLFLKHLHSRPMQEKALEWGFRPGDPSVPVKSPDQNNLWTKNADLGAQIDIPPVVNTPDGPVVHNLMTMWSRLMQK